MSIIFKRRFRNSFKMSNGNSSRIPSVILSDDCLENFPLILSKVSPGTFGQDFQETVLKVSRVIPAKIRSKIRLDVFPVYPPNFSLCFFLFKSASKFLRREKIRSKYYTRSKISKILKNL